MTTTINASNSGSGGLVQTADASGVLALQTAGVTAVTIDASQRVGIGTTSPGANLEVKGSSGQNIYVSYTSGSQLRLKSDSGDSGVGTTGSTPLLFLINNGEVARFNSSGNILCLSGGSTSATGTGIAFPATQSASTDANTLDDYEEGTFTPTITASSGSLGYQTQAGKYTKIGNTVICTFWIQWNSNNSLSGNPTYMSGLPFSSASGNQRPSPSIRAAGFSVTGVIGGWLPASDNKIQINVFNNGGTNDVNASSYATSGEFGGTIVYQS
jgi:hypothetical protein